MNKVFFLMAAILGPAVLVAESEGQVVTTRGPWTFRAGYAWRANMSTDFRGDRSAPPGGDYSDGQMTIGSDSWSGGSAATIDSEWMPGRQEHARTYSRDEALASGSDDQGAHGMSMSAGYDFFSSDHWCVGAAMRFAGYWGYEATTRGGYASYADTFRFAGLMADGGTPDPAPVSGDGNVADFARRDYLIGSAGGSDVRLRGDLYQIGLGPQVTWSPFAGWYDSMSWFDVYANVEVLCNIIRSELDAGAVSTSDTTCRVGFGGNVGIVGNISDNIGIFGQIGYEWIDQDDISMRGITAETDYSSLILSVGVQFRF